MTTTPIPPVGSMQNHTIQLDVDSSIPYTEGIAAAPIDSYIFPGALIKLALADPQSGEGTYELTRVEGEAGQRLFAIENVYSGGNIITGYASDDKMLAKPCSSGDRVLAWIDASATAVSRGTFLKGGGMSNRGMLLAVVPPEAVFVVAISLDSLSLGTGPTLSPVIIY